MREFYYDQLQQFKQATRFQEDMVSSIPLIVGKDAHLIKPETISISKLNRQKDLSDNCVMRSLDIDVV